MRTGVVCTGTYSYDQHVIGDLEGPASESLIMTLERLVVLTCDDLSCRINVHTLCLHIVTLHKGGVPKIRPILGKHLPSPTGDDVKDYALHVHYAKTDRLLHAMPTCISQAAVIDDACYKLHGNQAAAVHAIWRQRSQYSRLGQRQILYRVRYVTPDWVNNGPGLHCPSCSTGQQGSVEEVVAW